MMDRRQFLKAITVASAAPLWVRFSAVAAEAAEGGPVPIPSRLLLVLYLAGGNDGLNTVAPYLDPEYVSQRPGLSLRESEVLPIEGGLGFHPSLRRVNDLWHAGQVAIVQNVGYPNPNFSHFDSTYIWETASPDFRYHTGWLGRYLDRTDGPDRGPVRAVSVGTTGLPRTLIGDESSGVALTRLSDFAFADDRRPDAAIRHAAYTAFGNGVANNGSMLARVLEAQGGMTRSVAAVGEVAAQVDGTPTPAQTIAHMFAAGVGTEIGFISMGGFDTHTTQRGAQGNQLARVDEAIGAFFDTAAGLGLADRATVVTFSDFGRRVGENASNGTDHGSSMPVLVMGPRVRGGLYGNRPDLSRLVNGNMVPEIHLGSVYSSVLSQTFGVDPAPIIGGSFPLLPLIG